MGSGCFKGAASQVHPTPEGVVPDGVSARAEAAAVPVAAAAVPASASTAAPAAEAVTRPPAQQDVLSTPQVLQAPAVPPSAGAAARPKPKPTLVKAVKDGNMELIESLLQEGGDIEKLGMWDNTPLLAACNYGRNDAALKLISHKANVYAKNEHGATAMHYAAVEGSLGVVEALIASARATGKEGGADAASGLVNCGAANVYNRHLDGYARRTPLCSAAESGFTDMISTLLAAGAVLDEGSDEGRSALWLSCRHSRLSAAKLLLQRGARADAKDDHGVSVLGAALTACNEELVLALLSHGVGDVNDTAGLPLQDAVKAGKRAVVEALLTHGALVQPLKDDAATTPLHLACEKGDEYLVSRLVRARADPSKGNAAGQTAFDLLRRRGLPDGQIMALLSPPPASGQDGGTGTTRDVEASHQAASELPAG